jgi:hypothetical protein
MLGWIRHELGFLEMTSECEDTEDMMDYIQTRGKERRAQRIASRGEQTKEGEAGATDGTRLSQGDPFIYGMLDSYG